MGYAVVQVDILGVLEKTLIKVVETFLVELRKCVNQVSHTQMKMERNGPEIQLLQNHLDILQQISELFMRLQKMNVDQTWLPQLDV